MKPVGISAVATAYPSLVRTNAFFIERAPEVFAAAERKSLGSIFNTEIAADSEAFDAAMMPYLKDPFRGARQRFACAEGETGRGLELTAAREALARRGLGPRDLDFVISAGFLPDDLVPGNAAFLAEALGTKATVMNLEATCSGALLAFQVAAGLIQQGVARRVLVTVSCTYSRNMDFEDSLCWFLGDGAGAMIVEEVDSAGLLAVGSRNTAETCGAFVYAKRDAASAVESLVVRPGRNPSGALRSTAEPNLRHCVLGALDRAELELDDLAFLVCNTPVAWFHQFVSRALDLPEDKVHSTFPESANMGPVLTLASLDLALREGKIAPGDHVALYAFGTVSNATAAVMQWGRAASDS